MSIQASSGSMPLSCMQQVSFNEDKTDGTAAMAPVPIVARVVLPPYLGKPFPLQDRHRGYFTDSCRE